MELAAWLDVALEGGVLELERARADYRALRRLLVGDWRPEADQISECAEQVRSSHHKVEAALERARRRARVDAAATPAAVLADRVEEERKALLVALTVARGEEKDFRLQLDWLCEAASEESYFVSSRSLLGRERNVWTAFFLVVSPAIPISAWLLASEFGALHTVLSAEGLEDPAVWGSFSALLVGLVISWLRLYSWGWLGVRVPRLLQPAAVSGVAGALAAIAVISFGLRTPVPLAVAVIASTAVGVWQVLVAFWQLPVDPEC